MGWFSKLYYAHHPHFPALPPLHWLLKMKSLLYPNWFVHSFPDRPRCFLSPHLACIISLWAKNELSLLSHLSKFYHFLWPFKFFLPHQFFCKPPRFFFLHKGILWIPWALMSISYLAANQILPNCTLPLMDYVAISFQYLSLIFSYNPQVMGKDLILNWVCLLQHLAWCTEHSGAWQKSVYWLIFVSEPYMVSRAPWCSQH